MFTLSTKDKKMSEDKLDIIISELKFIRTLTTENSSKIAVIEDRQAREEQFTKDMSETVKELKQFINNCKNGRKLLIWLVISGGGLITWSLGLWHQILSILSNKGP